MNKNFHVAVKLVLGIEGCYSDDKRDSGGKTKYGISQKAFPNLKIVDITEEQAIEIYKNLYWDTCKCDELPAGFDVAVFDSAVNQGVKASITMLQKALNIKADGIIGKQTIAACQKAGERELRNYLLYRLFRYAQTQGFSDYKNGWFNRLIKISGAV